MRAKAYDPLATTACEALGPGWLGAEVAVVAGSGLGGAAEALDVRAEVPYDRVPGLGAPTVPGHSGRLLRGVLQGVETVFFQGRRHAYEGISLAQAALPARLAASLGARLLVSLSAVGGLDPSYGVGSWVLIEDHLNLMGRNPLEGVSGPLGPAFVDLTRAYRADLHPRILSRLAERGLRATSGVLAAFVGPSYETPAEVRMVRFLGAAAVGMSTVPEVVWSRYLGLDVLAAGRIANLAAGLGEHPLDHTEVVRQSESGAVEACQVLEECVAAWIRG